MALAGKDGVDDPTLAADLTQLLEAAGVRVSASGAGSVAVGHNEGIVSTGDQATNTSGPSVPSTRTRTSFGETSSAQS